MNQVVVPWPGIIFSILSVCILIFFLAIDFHKPSYFVIGFLIAVYGFAMSLGSSSSYRFVGYSGLSVYLTLGAYFLVKLFIVTNGFAD